MVCPDLRGYGQSSVPPTTADHSPYANRAMAADVVTVMRDLGHERFAVAGHDRGSYVAMRLALDSPEAVTALAVLDCVPIGALARADARSPPPGGTRAAVRCAHRFLPLGFFRRVGIG